MPVTNNKKLLFFNKEGYPYNFELDTDEIYKGKLIFDENSSDTFKTLGIYCFEEVSPFELTDYLTLNKMEIYNTSGISFQPSTYNNLHIDNITRVNSSQNFYSKWIFGDGFDEKFPKGTLVSFSGASFKNYSNLSTGTTEFINKYYTVLENKPNAILVNTPTNNKNWIFTYSTGATITSHNIVKINDYNKTLYNDILSWSPHTDKKFSIIGTQYNDNVNIYNTVSSGGTIYQTYNIDSFNSLISGKTGDILKLKFTLNTERPKLYQGPVTFSFSGATSYLQFERKINSNINFDEGQSIIFEDYNDNPILPTNPIFKILDGTTDIDMYSGSVEFIEELNINKSFMKHFDDNSLSSQAFVKNTTPIQFEQQIDDFLLNYPKSFFVYDYYLQITGSTVNFAYSLELGDIILLSSTTNITGDTMPKNNSRKFDILEIHRFRDLRIDFWKKQIIAYPPWYNDIKNKAIQNLRSVEEQLELDAIWMYNSQDNDINHTNYIPLTNRYEKIKVKEYIIPEESLNTYNIQKLLKSSQIRTVKCDIGSALSTSIQPFTMNVVAYDTESILTFSQEILPMSSSNEVIYRTQRLEYWKNYIISNPTLYNNIIYSISSSTIYMIDNSSTINDALDTKSLEMYNTYDLNKAISFSNTIDAFNNKYGDYLYNNYGILVYYSSITSNLNIHSIYYSNADLNGVKTYDKYFVPNVYIKDINSSGFTNITGITNSTVNNVMLEFDNQLSLERINPNDNSNFNSNFNAEIYFNLYKGETTLGFNLDINDQDYFIAYSANTQTTINNFISTYKDTFDKMNISLSSGYTILSSGGTSGYTLYSSTGVSWVSSDTRYSNIGYTIKLNAIYPDIVIRTLKPKVNIYSQYEILSKNLNKCTLLTGNEIKLDPKLSSATFFDYGFSTGMVVTITGSKYTKNNGSYNIIGMTENELDLSYQGEFFDDSITYTNVIEQIYNGLNNATLYQFDISGNTLFFDNLNTSITICGSTVPSYNGDCKIISVTPLPNNMVRILTNKPYSGTAGQQSTGYITYGRRIERELTLDVHTYLRKPRESSDKDVYYKWKFIPNVDGKFNKDMFFYDVSGEHLKPYLNDTRLEYIGEKPLWNTIDVCSNTQIHLIDEPNNKIEFISDPSKQQTMFRGEDGEYCLSFLLDEYDSATEYNYVPEPLQVFLGFNSNTEGVSKSSIVMEKIENIIFSGYTNSNNQFSFSSDGLLEYTSNIHNFNFINLGFEKNQPITIDFIDQSISGTTIFNNYGTMSIQSIGGNKIKLYNNIRSFTYFQDINFVEFNTSGNSSGYYYEIKVQPNPILKIDLYGETEIEDERFAVVLNNLGIQLNEDVESIFIDSDINEDGIDYIRLNQKRKEMLSVYPEIFNYVGSYKALINSINFFGWNDLQLYEYYKNINVNSPLYQKLHKVLIPDIFDNTVEGWTTNDYISGKYKTGNYKKTNLFNLTYRITDEDGDNILLYSLDEVQTKLSKLKRWLKRNALPLSTNIIDITGVADVETKHYQTYDTSNNLIKLESNYDDATVVNFVLTSTLGFQDNYMVEVEFYTISGYVPSGWTSKIQTFSMSTDGTNKLIPQKYFKLMKNDLGNFSFNIDKNVDEYIYIETCNYNDFGFGQKYHKMTNSTITKNYILVNNRFHIPDYNYLNVEDQYYFFDEQGYIFLKN